jgi:hypothetical protein
MWITIVLPCTTQFNLIILFSFFIKNCLKKWMQSKKAEKNVSTFFQKFNEGSEFADDRVLLNAPRQILTFGSIRDPMIDVKQHH